MDSVYDFFSTFLVCQGVVVIIGYFRMIEAFRDNVRQGKEIEKISHNSLVFLMLTIIIFLLMGMMVSFGENPSLAIRTTLFVFLGAMLGVLSEGKPLQKAIGNLCMAFMLPIFFPELAARG